MVAPINSKYTPKKIDKVNALPMLFNIYILFYLLLKLDINVFIIIKWKKLPYSNYPKTAPEANFRFQISELFVNTP
jgi:hypothetical protein